MAIIYSYPITTPTDPDLLIISRVPTDPDEISNFSVSMSSVADYVVDRFVDPGATDFQIPVFNQNGTRITGSIMSQDSSPSNGVAGTKITIAGNVKAIGNNNLTPIFDFDAIIDGNQYTPPTNTVLYKLQSGQENKFSITQDGGGGVVLPSGDILNNGPSFNMGGQAFANGENSLSVGAATTAFGNGSFAANFITLASGGGSAAFGLLTEASALASASFGNKSKATGAYSIASGQDSIASGQSSVAIGEKGDAQGKNTFVSGFGGTATGNNAVKFGYEGSASGNNSAKFGFESIASGANSLATGDGTTASGFQSVATGDNNIVSGGNSFIGGKNSTVTGSESIAYGLSNTVDSNSCAVFGGSNNITSGSFQSFVVGSSNTVNFGNAIVLGEGITTDTDTIIDNNTNVALGKGTPHRYDNVAITSRTLRLGKADNIAASQFNTTGILNFNDSVTGNAAYSNVGGFVGYFPPPTATNNYNFFGAYSENVLDSVFQPGDSPTASRMAISMDPNLDCVGYKFDSNTSSGGGVYYNVSQNNASASSRGIVTFDIRHQNQNYSVPNGHKLFELTSGYGQTKFEITQASGGGTANGAAALNFGKGNSSTGQGSVAMGQNLIVSANQSFAAGIGNEVASIYAAAFGDSNVVTTSSFSSFVAGDNNNTNSNGQVKLIGSNLIASTQFGVYLGRYNDNTDNYNKFQIGNGTAGDAKSNALSINSAGYVKLPTYGSGNVSGTATRNLSVAANGQIIETPVVAGRDYLSFVCLLTQSGATNPQPDIVLENSLGIATPFTAFTRVSSGEYNLNATGKFKLLKTIVFLNGGSAENNHDVAWEVIDTDNLRIRTHNSDDKLTKASLEIRTYN